MGHYGVVRGVRSWIFRQIQWFDWLRTVLIRIRRTYQMQFRIKLVMQASSLKAFSLGVRCLVQHIALSRCRDRCWWIRWFKKLWRWLSRQSGGHFICARGTTTDR